MKQCRELLVQDSRAGSLHLEAPQLGGPLSIIYWSRDPRLRGDKLYRKTGFHFS